MKFKNVEDIKVWQKSVDLGENVYRVFYGCRDWSFKDQIQRAAISVSNNIAEGYERGSNKDFIRFLYIAKGSCGEVRSMMVIAVRLSYCEKSVKDSLYDDADYIIRMISKLISALKPP